LATFADLLPGVARGDWLVNTALFITEERRKLVRFSQPVWALADGLMTRAGELEQFGTYEGIAADPAARLGIVTGQVQAETACGAGIPAGRIIGFVAPETVVAALKHGDVEAYASVAFAHRGFLARHRDPALAFTNLGDARFSGMAGSIPAFGAFSFARENTAFADAFDAALTRFVGSDAHREIMDRHGFTIRDGIAWG
jgi:polar amino acid transport system substrate-binding protein